jgi:nitroreductase
VSETDSLLPLHYRVLPETEMRLRAEAFRKDIRKRRSVRSFSDRPVARDIIEQCILAAGSAPSGANRQPWHFVVVSDPAIKKKIRSAAEKEERLFYDERATEEWLAALAPLGTDASKPFLEQAPYLIVIFAESHGKADAGQAPKNYYVQESVGIATGLLITAIHVAGLVSLTHTPSPMRFLNEILDRPANERPYLILVVGYPARDCQVPAISRKSLDEIATFMAPAVPDQEVR